MGVKNKEEDERLRLIAEQVSKEYKEREIHNLLVKAVKDNIDKFEIVNGEYLFEDLKVKSKVEKYLTNKDHSITITIIYKNLSSEYQISLYRWFALEEDYNNGKKIDDVFFNLQKNYKKRQKDKFIEQQEQDLKELKKLCNTKN